VCVQGTTTTTLLQLLIMMMMMSAVAAMWLDNVTPLFEREKNVVRAVMTLVFIHAHVRTHTRT